MFTNNAMRLLPVVLVLALAGCGLLSGSDDGDRAIVVTGVGAPDMSTSNTVQRGLMAARASEVDAYRALAEQLKGVQISASSKVSGFITDYDHMRVTVNSYLRQAQVVSQGITEAGHYETTLSLVLDTGFFELFSGGQSTAAALEPPSSDATTGEQPAISTLSTSASHYGPAMASESKMTSDQ